MCSPYENPAGRSRRRRMDDKNSPVYNGLADSRRASGSRRHQGPCMQHSVGTDEEHSAALLVAAAEALLTAQNPAVPSDFIAGLFDRAAPEDLVRYDGREIAALTESAWAFLAERRPGTPKLRIASPAGASELLRHTSVIEIVNDDMPFLLDSVMGELAERGIEARLVVHPVFTVTRDPSGRLTGFEGLRPLGRRRVARKLHPHPPRPHRRRGAARRADRGARDGARGRAARRRGLAGDDRARRRDRRRAQGQSAAAAEGRDRGGGRVPGMAGRRQFHLPRRPRLRLHRQGGRARADARDRARPVALAGAPRAAHRHPARVRSRRSCAPS